MAPKKTDTRRRRKPKTKSMYKIAKKVLAQQVQTNYYDSTVAEASSWSGSTPTSLSIISRGITFNDRIGDQIVVTSIKGWINFVGNDTTNVQRFCIFQWFADSTVLVPTPSYVWEPSYFGAITAPFSPYNKDTTGTALNILYDSGPVLTETVAGNQQKVRKISIGSKKLNSFKGNDKLTYASAVAAGNNQIFMVSISDSGVVSHPIITGVLRLTFRP